MELDIQCMSLSQEMGCRVFIDGYYGDQMMNSHAHLLKLARRLAIFSFDGNLPHWPLR